MNCKFGVPVDENEARFLCDNPDLKTFGKNVKHGKYFNCGYGLMWNAPDTSQDKALICPGCSHTNYISKDFACGEPDKIVFFCPQCGTQNSFDKQTFQDITQGKPLKADNK
jgi:hypothetical protein